MVLYILGNGFDIAHGLECKYKDFKRFLEKNNKESELNTLLDTFPLDYEWNNFESSLAHPNKSIEDSINKLGFGCIIKREIQDAFNKWISTIDGPVNKMAIFPCESIFVNFNYTSILEMSYDINIKRVCHIHRNSIDKYFFSDSAKTDLAFGHGVKISPDKKDTLVGCLYKDTETLYMQSKPFFDNWMYMVDRIVVIGFSYSFIDELYFRKIKETAPDAKWFCGWFNQKDKGKARTFMARLGIKHYTLCESNDLLLGRF